MDQIETYKSLAELSSSTDYGNRAAVKKHNQAGKQMSEIAKSIGREQSVETIRAFVKLLDSTNQRVKLWVAVHALEHLPLEAATEAQALEIIKEAAKGETAEAMGFRVWLAEWNRKRQ